MKRYRFWFHRLCFAACCCLSTQAFAQVSSDGLLIEYLYELSNGGAVTDGASAAGQIDDSGAFRTNHAIGSGGGELIAPHYQVDVPGGIGSMFSVNFPAPESPANMVSIPMSEGDELSSVTVEDFRVEAWFRTTDSGRSNLVSSYSGPTTALNLELHTDNRGRIYVQGPDSTTDLNLTLPGDSRDGEWHHLAGVREEDIIELYYDGELVGEAADTAGSYTINKSNFFLGMDGRESGTPRFQGSLDDVRFYNSADTSSLIAEYLFETVEGAAVTDGLVMNDQVDDTANVGPFHGIGPSLFEQSSPTYVADTPAVLANSMYAFAVDEQSASVEDGRIAVSADLAGLTNGDFAIETWFKTEDEGRGVLLGGFAGGADTVNLELHTNNRVRIYIDGPTITDLNVTAEEDTRDGEWHHLVGQRADDVVSLYLNGEFVGEVFDVSGDFDMEVQDVFLGKDSRSGGTQFDGLLDNTRIWSRALSDEEIASLAAGAALTGRFALGDLDGDGSLTAADIDLLSAAIRVQETDAQFDLNNSGTVDQDDLTHMVANLQATWFGDANLDGEFNSSDFVDVFAIGEYEDGVDQNSTWADGDWDGDGEFTTSDFVKAFADGGYEIGPRTAVAAVPEPTSLVALILAGAICLFRRRGPVVG